MSKEKKSGAGLWALFAKLGGKVLPTLGKTLPKLLKGLKSTKALLALFSFGSYALVYNWKFGLLLMAAIGFHESGHVWAMKKMGIKTKGFYFLPFIGGAAIAEEEYKTYGENAYIAIMGPVWGALLAGICAVIYYVTGVPWLAAAAAWMATLNIFNLLPITPLDGGQLMRSIAFSINKTLGVTFLVLSMLLGIVIMFKLKIGLFALILFVGGLELFLELRKRLQLAKVKSGELPKWKLPASMLDESQPDGLKLYPASMNVKQLALTATSYVGTLVVLLVILFMTSHVPGADLAKSFLE